MLQCCVRPSVVCLSVVCNVSKRRVSTKNCLNKQIGNGLWRIERYVTWPMTSRYPELKVKVFESSRKQLDMLFSNNRYFYQNSLLSGCTVGYCSDSLASCCDKSWRGIQIATCKPFCKPSSSLVLNHSTITPSYYPVCTYMWMWNGKSSRSVNSANSPWLFTFYAA